MVAGNQDDRAAWIKRVLGISITESRDAAVEMAHAVAALELFSDRAAKLIPSLPAANAGGAAWAQPIRAKLNEANALARKLDLPTANSRLDEVESMLGEAVKRNAELAAMSATEPVTPKAALQKWTDARADVLASLKRLEAAIRAMQHPKGDKAVIEVMSIAANLTKAPSSKAQVDGLRRYLTSDDVIACVEAPNGFGVPIRIRTDLIPILDILEGAMVQ